MHRALVPLALGAGVFLSLASTVDDAVDGSLARGDASGGSTDLGLGGDSASGLDAGGGRDTYTPGYDAYNPGYDAYTPGYDAAASGTCTLNDIFYNSTNVCNSGYFCGIDQNYAPTCLPNAASQGGTFYGDCGTNGECPVGSFCSGPSQTELTCNPFCSETHTDCPDNGSCIYVVTGHEEIMLCGATDDCDPVANTGCTSGGCYITGQDEGTMCFSPAGTAQEGASCTYINDCAPGLLCMGGTNGCMRMCNIGSDVDCDGNGTCQGVQGLTSYGVCA